jgi:iron complex transport system ATP-binding protein
MALHADEVVVMAEGRVLHHGAAHHPDTHAAVEQVFDTRLSIHSVAGQWVVLPRL